MSNDPAEKPRGDEKESGPSKKELQEQVVELEGKLQDALDQRDNAERANVILGTHLQAIINSAKKHTTGSAFAEVPVDLLEKAQSDL